jgi:hypothetical protein
MIGTAIGTGQQGKEELRHELIPRALNPANTAPFVVVASIINPGRFLSIHSQNIVPITVTSMWDFGW